MAEKDNLRKRFYSTHLLELIYFNSVLKNSKLEEVLFAKLVSIVQMDSKRNETLAVSGKFYFLNKILTEFIEKLPIFTNKSHFQAFKAEPEVFKNFQAKIHLIALLESFVIEIYKLI